MKTGLPSTALWNGVTTIIFNLTSKKTKKWWTSGGRGKVLSHYSGNYGETFTQLQIMQAGLVHTHGDVHKESRLYFLRWFQCFNVNQPFLFTVYISLGWPVLSSLGAFCVYLSALQQTGDRFRWLIYLASLPTWPWKEYVVVKNR